ncbi:unnamed protein product [Calicophoron daubneyi]|uniref:Hsp70-binding protein 1 n=1 Tax=Calicophoron daubneyi TaxID=300641 RepID=A0AAV2TEF1_CALDB
MSENEVRNLKEVLRFSLQHSDGMCETGMDPETVAWLREALSSASVDLTKELRDSVDSLHQILESEDPQESKVRLLLDNILSLTEDIDLANDFFRIGGCNILLRMLYKGPPWLRADCCQLVANVTQNNPNAQSLCLQKNVLAKLLEMLPDEEDLRCLKKLLLAISCSTRGFLPGVKIFSDLRGFEAVSGVMFRLLDSKKYPDASSVRHVQDKAAFLIFCLVQEAAMIPGSADNIRWLPDKLAHLLLQSPTPQEHLLGCLLIVLTGSSSIDAAVDVENSHGFSRTLSSPVLSTEVRAQFSSWLCAQDKCISSGGDSADFELRTYIGALRRLLST